jgi:hypothetical protein
LWLTVEHISKKIPDEDRNLIKKGWDQLEEDVLDENEEKEGEEDEDEDGEKVDEEVLEEGEEEVEEEEEESDVVREFLSKYSTLFIMNQQSES